jgi:hypothetical protein
MLVVRKWLPGAQRTSCCTLTAASSSFGPTTAAFHMLPNHVSASLRSFTRGMQVVSRQHAGMLFEPELDSHHDCKCTVLYDPPSVHGTVPCFDLLNAIQQLHAASCHCTAHQIRHHQCAACDAVSAGHPSSDAPTKVSVKAQRPEDPIICLLSDSGWRPCHSFLGLRGYAQLYCYRICATTWFAHTSARNAGDNGRRQQTDQPRLCPSQNLHPALQSYCAVLGSRPCPRV